MRNRYLLVADVVACALSVWAAFAFRFGWDFLGDRAEFSVFLLWAVPVKILVFLGFGLYRRYWRYAGFWDMVAVVMASSLASVLLTGLMVFSVFMGWVNDLPRSVIPLDWLFATASVGGVRASLRAIAETMTLPVPLPKTTRRVLIVGAGDAGTMVAREMQKNPQLGQRPVGYLDDDAGKGGKDIYGVPVLGRMDALPTVVERHGVSEVVIAIPTAGGSTVRAIVEQCRTLGLPSRVMPGIYELLGGQLSVNRLRSVEISDLLRRTQVNAGEGPPPYLRDSVVAITGAGGSIGSELCRQVAHASPKKLLLIGHGENSIFDIAAELRSKFPSLRVQATIADVRDADRIRRIFQAAAPRVVFHAAAHKHVPLMEDNASEAVTNNVRGTRNVVNAALAVGVERLVMVSTDKAAAPSNMMGASKRLAEAIVQRAARTHNKPYVVVRFGNVLGSRGSVVPIFKAQIERGGPVTVTHRDVRRYFMTIPEAVHLILQAGGVGEGGELFVLDMGEPVLLRDLAADMIRLSGLEEADVPIVFTGLRPGEKLDEILWEDGASVEPTAQHDIRRVRERRLRVTDDRLDSLIDELVDAAARDDSNRIAHLFCEGIETATISRETKTPPEHLRVVPQVAADQ